MEYSLRTLLTLFFCHLLADFFFQSHDMAQRKSKELKVLLQHVLIHFFFTYWSLWILGYGTESLIFAFYNSVIHGVIDWNIWRGYKAFRTRHPILKCTVIDPKPGQVMEIAPFWEDHYFYVTIGCDQFLHAATIIILNSWLLN